MFPSLIIQIRIIVLFVLGSIYELLVGCWLVQEAIMPADKKRKFLDSELEKVIDFYVSAESDVFVPAISGLFYANVVGKRIGSGKTRILVPASSASASNFLSPYVSNKNHFAYSCYC